MRRPTPEQLAPLSRFERFAFEVADMMNRPPAVKAAAHTFLRVVGEAWVTASTNNLLHVRGVEHVRDLRPDRGVFLVANHRSFFDFYVISAVVLRSTKWVKRMYFPVRSTFFYESVAGMAVNAVMSAMAMYPPVMRDGPKRVFNQYTVDVLTDLMREPGTMVGFHPEGTRNKGENPYELLPANLGAGTIVYHAQPIVVPVFTLGLINNFPRQIMSNFDGTGAPITMLFGAPMDLSEHLQKPPRLRTYKAIAEHLREALMALGAQERAMREALGLPSLVPRKG
jgi:1-acyl-sn-glycerol-3-phosphate acyltransferase